MAIVTITSDWRGRDYYPGMLKGRLLSLDPDLRLVEINQEVQPFGILEGAFLIKQVIPSYPAGTVHLFLVNPGNRPDVFPVVIRLGDQFVIGWEDAALGLIPDSRPTYTLRVTPEVFGKLRSDLQLEAPKVFPSFPELGIFPVLAYAVTRGYPLDQVGPDQPEVLSASPWLPVIQDQTISGQVIYLDSYGNAISNISKDLFTKLVKDRKFDILLVSNHYRINRINTGYLETEPGDMLALFNSANLLELAIVHGSMAALLGLETGSAIKVKIYE